MRCGQCVCNYRTLWSTARSFCVECDGWNYIPGEAIGLPEAEGWIQQLAGWRGPGLGRPLCCICQWIFPCFRLQRFDDDSPLSVRDAKPRSRHLGISFCEKFNDFILYSVKTMKWGYWTSHGLIKSLSSQLADDSGNRKWSYRPTVPQKQSYYCSELPVLD